MRCECAQVDSAVESQDVVEPMDLEEREVLCDEREVLYEEREVWNEEREVLYGDILMPTDCLLMAGPGQREWRTGNSTDGEGNTEQGVQDVLEEEQTRKDKRQSGTSVE
jgi:hypothetical protein